MARHKWNMKSNGKGGREDSSVQCVKCGCVKQWVGGKPTYFIDDTVYDIYAPKCDEREIIKYHVSWNTDNPSEEVQEAVNKMVHLVYEQEITNN